MERAVMRAAADAGVPVPDVLDILNEEGPGEPVMLLGVVHGAAPDPAALDKDVVAAVGRVLGLIHSLDVGTGYGNLDDELRGSSTSFEEWFVDGIAPAVERACEALAGDTEALAGLHRAANVIAERGPVLAADDAVLLHGDFRPGNLLFDGTELVAVIDWEAAKRGPAGLDLAWWDWAAEGAVLTADALIDGYVQVRPLDTASLGEVRHVATARILIGHLDWAVQTGDAYAAESARERLRAFGGE
jgi:aminoglycoside phosphotransferase (APT) family kinase protein